MEHIKIRKTILSDSLELSGLSQFQGQEVEIVISLAVSKPEQPGQRSGFMRFAGIAANETALLEELETEVMTNWDLDLRSYLNGLTIANWSTTFNPSCISSE